MDKNKMFNNMAHNTFIKWHVSQEKKLDQNVTELSRMASFAYLGDLQHRWVTCSGHLSEKLKNGFELTMPLWLTKLSKGFPLLYTMVCTVTSVVLWVFFNPWAGILAIGMYHFPWFGWAGTIFKRRLQVIERRRGKGRNGFPQCDHLFPYHQMWFFWCLESICTCTSIMWLLTSWAESHKISLYISIRKRRFAKGAMAFHFHNTDNNYEQVGFVSWMDIWKCKARVTPSCNSSNNRVRLKNAHDNRVLHPIRLTVVSVVSHPQPLWRVFLSRVFAIKVFTLHLNCLYCILPLL